MENDSVRDKLNQYTYYIIIIVVSLFALLFLPMLGSEVGVGIKYPDTIAGQVVYWTTKVIVAILNVLIFDSFVKQAKVNIRNHPNYIQANDILMRTRTKVVNPRSPKKMYAEVYSKKGTSIFASTFLGLIALTQAVLTFDYVSMLTYLFTITMGIIFGVLQMKKTEIYWIEEYLLYAQKVEKEKSNDNN